MQWKHCRVPMSAAAARRIGGLAHGRRPVFGPPCTVRCWSSFRTPMRSTDRARPSTARAYLQRRGSATGPNSTDQEKPSTKRHLVVDANGTSLGSRLTGTHCHDSRMLAAPLNAVPAYAQGVGVAHGADRTSCTLTRATIIAVVEVSAGAQHHTSDRPARHQDQRTLGTLPPDRGAHPGVAGSLPSPRHPLRAARRPPPRLHDARLPSSAELGPNGFSLTLSVCLDPDELETLIS